MSDKRRGIVAAGNQLTAAAGAEVLADGGNAYDALIACLFASFASEPVLSSPGGGGFLLAKPQGRPASLIDFFTQTPRLKVTEGDLEFERMTVDFGATHQDFHIGQGSVATPGMVAGLFDIHARFGTRPMKVLAEQGIALARKGHMIDPLQADILQVVKPIFQAHASARKLFASKVNDGDVLGNGETLVLAEMADFLEVLTLEGPGLFYKGEVAKAILAGQRDGGALTAEDLARYEVRHRTPLAHNMGHFTFTTNPPPSSGGTLVGVALALLSEVEAWRHDPSTGGWALRLLASLQFAHTAWRESGFAEDPQMSTARHMLSDTFLAPLATAIKKRAQKVGGTSHISITDGFGNVAACTMSNGEGCGHLVSGAGFMLNNMLGEEDLNPHGFFEWQADSRISSMMAPSLLSFQDGREIALGSGGSNRIRTALSQVAARIGFFGETPEDAVIAPRIHVEAEQIDCEAGFDEEFVDVLRKADAELTHWPGQSFYFGGVHVAETGPRGARGAADPRRGGAVIEV